MAFVKTFKVKSSLDGITWDWVERHIFSSQIDGHEYDEFRSVWFKTPVVAKHVRI